MDFLKKMIRECIKEKKSPEEFLGLQGGYVPSEGLDADEVYEQARQRVPRTIQLFVLLRGVDTAKDISILFSDMVPGMGVVTQYDTSADITIKEDIRWTEKQNKLEAPKPRLCRDVWIEIGRCGISLSWVCFGKGDEIVLEFDVCKYGVENGRAREDYENDTVKSRQKVLLDMRIMANIRQGWEDTYASRWCIPTVQQEKVDPIVARGALRLACGMPRVKVFPDMPMLYNVYMRLRLALDRFEITEDLEPWLFYTATLLKKKNWKAYLLLLSSQSSVAPWRLGVQKTRSVIDRLAFLVDRLLDIYGERKGLIYLLQTLHAEALYQGFENGLMDVVQRKRWSRRTRQKKGSDSDDASE